MSNPHNRNRLLRPKEIYAPFGILSISRAKFYDLLKKREFPQGLKISDRIRVWPERDVCEWAKERDEKYRNSALVDVRDLAERQRMGRDANVSDASARWETLADELAESGRDLESFVDERSEGGTRTYSYLTRSGRRRTYPHETMMRELRKILKARRKTLR